MIEASAQVASYGAVDFLTPEQSMIELGLTHTVSAVLQQCSKPIFMVCTYWLWLPQLAASL